MEETLKIGGPLESVATDKKVADAIFIKDSAMSNKTQRQINSDLSSAIEAILLLIPSAASSLNKLADKAYVDSSVATNSATFRGTFNLVNDLHLTVSATHAQICTALANAILSEDNNDFAYVQIPTSDAEPTEIAQTDRYKYNGTTWEYEYTLNNSGFTSDQWAAINSGITEALVTKLSALPTNSELTEALGVLTSSITTINQKIPSAASQANQLVDTAAMESYIVQVLDVLTATFNVTSSDGHVTVQISQVDGKITSFALTTLDIASAASLSLVEGRVTTAEGNISTNSADIAILQDAYAALTQSEMVVIAPTDTWPVANPEEQTIYRVVDRTNTPPQYYSDYMWNGTAMVLMATYDNAIDPRPKKASQNLVTSGGVFDNMGALDVSELNATENPHTLAQYADLSAALAAIPTDYRKGGMSIKFVQSSDHKYVQYRYIGTSVTGSPNPFLNTANWQTVDIPDIQLNINIRGDGNTESYNGRFVLSMPFNVSDNSVISIYSAIDNTKPVTKIACYDNSSALIEVLTNSFVLPSGTKYIKVCIQIDSSAITINDVRSKKYVVVIDNLSYAVDTLIYEQPILNNNIRERLNRIGSSLTIPFVVLENKIIDYGDAIVDSSGRACSEEYYKIEDIEKVSSNGKLGVILYKNSKTRLQNLGWLNKNSISHDDLIEIQNTYPNAKYIRFNLDISGLGLGFIYCDVFQNVYKNGIVSPLNVTLGKSIGSTGSVTDVASKASILDYISISDFESIYTTDCDRIIIREYDEDYNILWYNTEWKNRPVIYSTDIKSPKAVYVRLTLSKDNDSTLSVATALLVKNNSLTKQIYDNKVAIEDQMSFEQYDESFDFEIGKVVAADGTVISNSSRACISSYIPVSTFAELKTTTDDVAIIVYDNNHGWLGSHTWFGRNRISYFDVFSTNPKAVYFRANFRMSNEGTVVFENTCQIRTKNVFEKDAFYKSYDARDLSDKGIVVSDISTEFMTQCPSSCYDNHTGMMYVGYYAGSQYTGESADPTVWCKLAKFPVAKPQDVQYIDILKAGETVGDYTQSSDYATYDPQIVMIGDTIKYLMIACEDVNHRQYVLRNINKDTLAKGDSIIPLQFTYTYNESSVTIDMEESQLSVYVDRLLNRAAGTSYFGRPILSNVVKSGSYYYAYLGGLVYDDNTGKGYCGTLIKSEDCINWEEVSAPIQYMAEGITDIWEGAVAITDGKVYIMYRAANSPIATYDLTNQTWSTLVNSIPKRDDGRNFLYVRGNNIFAFGNCTPRYDTIDGTMIRSRIEIVKYDTSLVELGRANNVISRFGLCYPVVQKAGVGEYIICAENRRFDYKGWEGDNFGPTYPCTDIAIIPIDFLDDI